MTSTIHAVGAVVFLAAALTLSPLAAAAPPAGEPAAAPAFPTGQMIEGVAAVAAPEQTYTLYLPAAYTAQKRWPVLFVLDPRGRSRFAAELFQGGAERLGYILISSDNSRSDTPAGAAEPNSPAFNALYADAVKRFAIDPRRIYLAGFSGTAKFSWAVAFHLAGDIAGVIGCGAGLPGADPQGWLDPGHLDFVYFGTTGTRDFNHREVYALDRWLDERAMAHRVEYFPGEHSWAPAEILDEALVWLEVQAVKRGRRERDEALLDAAFAGAVAAARRLEEAGDLYAAWQRYRQTAADFAGLRDVAAVTAEAARLAALPAVHRAEAQVARAVADEIAYQGRLNRLLAELDQGFPIPRSLALVNELEIPQLLHQAAGVGIAADSAGSRLASAHVHAAFYLPRAFFARGDYERAAVSLEVATAIEPDSPGSWYDLACAWARTGRAEKAVEALGRAVEAGYQDLAHLQADADLAAIRDQPGYRALIDALAEKQEQAPPG